jgi:hypothetical protein
VRHGPRRPKFDPQNLSTKFGRFVYFERNEDVKVVSYAERNFKRGLAHGNFLITALLRELCPKNTEKRLSSASIISLGKALIKQCQEQDPP